VTSEPVARRVWKGPAVNPLLRPAFDGRQVAYVDPGTGDVAVHDLATGADRRLTNTAVEAKPGDFADSPIASPDGQSVAYAWWSSTDDRFELRITVPGGATRIVAPPGGRGAMMPLAWSRDGSRLAVALLGRSGETELGIASVDGAVAVVPGTARVQAALGSVQFGRERTTLLVDVRQARERSDSFDVADIDVASGGVRPIVASAANDRLAGLTGDGSAVLFFSDREGTTSLYAQPVTAELRPAGSPLAVARDIWSGTGVGTTSTGALLYTIQTGVQTLFSAQLDAAAGTLGSARPMAIVASVTSEPVAEWTGGGASTIQNFTPTRGLGTGAVTVRSVLSGDTRDVKTSLASVSTLHASPDGSRVLANGRDRANRIGVYVIDVASGETRTIATASYDTPAMVRGAGWSSDSRAVYYTVEEFQRDRVRLVARDVLGGEERTMVDLPCTARCAGRVSPDGRLFAMVQAVAPNGMRLVLVPTGGGEAREVARLPSPQWFTSAPAWTPDGKSLVVATGEGDRPTAATFLVAHTDGSAPALATLSVGGPVTGVRVHPDGRHVLFIAGKSAFEMWRLDSLPLRPSH
jgi:Tol biopolymer transport system component